MLETEIHLEPNASEDQRAYHLKNLDPNQDFTLLLGYGSQFKKQGETLQREGSKDDYIAVISDDRLVPWLEQHPEYFPPSWKNAKAEDVAKLITEGFGGIYYFHTDMEHEGGNKRRSKVGITTLSRYKQDSLNRTDCYVAGRNHKPTEELWKHPEYAEKIDEINYQNRYRAVITTLLAYPYEQMSKEDFYVRLASESYRGAVRYFAPPIEDLLVPKKVTSIVNGQIEEFDGMYTEIIRSIDGIDLDENGVLNQSLTDDQRRHLIDALPSEVKQLSQVTPDDRPWPAALKIREALRTIVHRSSRTQMAKGWENIGLIRGFLYAASKFIRTIKKVSNKLIPTTSARETTTPTNLRSDTQ